MMREDDKQEEFENLWFLKFKNSQLERDFKEYREQSIIKLNPYFTVFTLIVALSDTIFQLLIENEMIRQQKNWIYSTKYLSYSVVCAAFLNLVLVFAIKNKI